MNSLNVRVFKYVRTNLFMGDLSWIDLPTIKSDW